VGYVKGYLEALDKCEEICASYIADLRKQAGPAKISVACINNIVEFLRDDIQAHGLAIRQDYGIPDPKQVLRVGMGETDNAPTLSPDLGSPEFWKKKPLGELKSFSRGVKKRRS
jgi:hypothetical protein